MPSPRDRAVISKLSQVGDEGLATRGWPVRLYGPHHGRGDGQSPDSRGATGRRPAPRGEAVAVRRQDWIQGEQIEQGGRDRRYHQRGGSRAGHDVLLLDSAAIRRGRDGLRWIRAGWRLRHGHGAMGEAPRRKALMLRSNSSNGWPRARFGHHRARPVTDNVMDYKSAKCIYAAMPFLTSAVDAQLYEVVDRSPGTQGVLCRLVGEGPSTRHAHFGSPAARTH